MGKCISSFNIEENNCFSYEISNIATVEYKKECPAMYCGARGGMNLGGDDGNRTHDESFADSCLAAWPRRPNKKLIYSLYQFLSRKRAMGLVPTTFSLARRRSTN